MTYLSAFEREALITAFTGQEYDLLVIGGGITGAGIALDAASRGLRTALVEKGDFASGTSSRSTKLIHGGLRYLKQFEIALVREVGRERAIVHKLAPHLVVSEKMLLPIVKGGSFGKIMTSVGLVVYDVLAGVERADQRKMLNKEEALAAEPLLPGDITEGAAIYAEYRTDDARLTIEVMKTAAQHGARCINYTSAEDFIYADGKVRGMRCHDHIGEVDFEVRARFVVSAAGPWVDDIRTLNQSKSAKRLRLTKGVHLVVPHERFPVRQSVYFDVEDGRMIFAIPRGKVTYVGTTDTFYSGDKDAVVAEYTDVRYLLDAVNRVFGKVALRIDDVISSWAGLRPLIQEVGKSASAISRKDEIFESDTGLLSIAGGKLTGYRMMAKKLVDTVARRYASQHAKPLKTCQTHAIVLQGGQFEDAADVAFFRNRIETDISRHGLPLETAHYLVSNYGRQTSAILNKMQELPAEHPAVRLAKAELWYCIHNEMVYKPMDFFSRRTGWLYFDTQKVMRVKPHILREFQEYFDWDDAQLDRETTGVDEALYRATRAFRDPADSPARTS